ncbi:MAG: glycosyltransferase family 2 protein [Candidatus Roizmanbacteria bacterium]|nr:glycosyltransferase family 2 protein [Candidatus Roizmanbacteria bacterium]
MRRVSIIIPVFNEESFITTVLEKVVKAKTGKLSKEIIVINDGSTDNTAKKIKFFIKKYPRAALTVITHTQNQGKGASLKKGFLHSSGDIVIVQDADLEYSTDDYPTILEPFLRYGANVVYGSRFIGNRPHRILYFGHYLANQFLTFLSNLYTNLNLTDMETGSKAFDGKLIRTLAGSLESTRFGFEPEITARISRIPNLKLFEVGISYSGRTYHEGKKVSFLDGIYAVYAILRYNLL